MRKSILVPTAFIAGMVIASAGTATAAKLITSKDIKDDTIKAKDLSPALRARLGVPGPPGAQGPQGDPGPKGDQGAAGVSLFTFADSAVTPAINLSGPDTVVTTTAAQLPNASGAVGGPIAIPAGAGRSVTTYNLRVKTTGGGDYTCAVQISVDGGSFFDIDRASSSVDVMRVSFPSGGYLNGAPRTYQYRVVCNDGAGTRSVTDTDLTVAIALQLT